MANTIKTTFANDETYAKIAPRQSQRKEASPTAAALQKILDYTGRRQEMPDLQGMR